MKGPKISIVIPTYNAGQTIFDCLNSLAQQQYTNVEIIIVDGLSTDNTINIVQSFLSIMDVRFVSGKDNGIYDAMNKGIQIAKGEWIYFMGSDDRLINEEVLSEVAGYLKSDNDIVYGDVVLLPGGDKESDEWGYLRLLHMCINHQRVFYKALLFKKLGSFNTDYLIAADYDLNIRFFCNPGIVAKHIVLPIAFYNTTGYSTGKIDEPFWNNFKTVMLKSFSPHLSNREIYGRLSFYCWYKMHKKEYSKALRLFADIFYNTHSVNFLTHSLSQLIKSIKH
ncbi:MAG: glycosyl transferase family 2 [Ferruginibacter sp.]|uniref:glycosyltransferase family 2 protein n=1 Tax=Ferruginibacter sp. TaxID=1940288 RepID=UPI0026580FBD|nr:glycosyltransferase family 2 protein [Ferruginibacter sp.]MDB5280356.1 glycosyl transferase family 2 [Ferruginibacter sp.]